MKNRLKENEVIIEITPEIKSALKRFLMLNKISDLGSKEDIAKMMMMIAANIDKFEPKVLEKATYGDVAKFIGVQEKTVLNYNPKKKYLMKKGAAKEKVDKTKITLEKEFIDKLRSLAKKD